MSQYPVNTTPGVYDAVNYLLSGPAGLGQNFAGFSDYNLAWLTGTYTQPFTTAYVNTTTAVVPQLTAGPYSITSATILGNATGTNWSNNYEIFFTNASTSTYIFHPGDTVTVSGVKDSINGIKSNFNGDGTILSATTNTAIFQTIHTYTFGTYVASTATIYKSNLNKFISTDANARVTVSGPTQIVSISAQANITTLLKATTTSTVDLIVAINRYVTNTAVLTPGTDYYFNFDKTVSQRVYTAKVVNTGTGYILNYPLDVVFTSVLDQPSFGYYWYILELQYSNTSFLTGQTYPGDAQPFDVLLDIRNLTAQVIKA